MTIQAMDISLNISTAPAVNKSKKTTGYKKEFFKPQFKRQVKKSIRDKAKAESEESGGNPPAVKRVKQKSLAAIVARNLNRTKEPDSTYNESKSKSIKFNSKSDGAADKPIVAFAKSGEETTIRTILAKKRDKNLNPEKKSLTDIFSGNIKPVDFKAGSTRYSQSPASLDSDKKEGGSVIDLKRKLNGSKERANPQSYKKVKFDDSRKNEANYKDLTKISKKNHWDNDSDKPAHRGGVSGKISSLFGNNPEIPNMGQRFVRPVDEAVFSGTNFTDFDLHPFMVSNLEQNMQITKLTTVQQKAIPEILSGKDVLVRSQTGSGKTLAYALPIVESLHKVRPKLTRDSGLRALVVVPTRELALQTYECFLKLIKSFTWIVPGYLVGGEKRKAEKARLRRGCTILVATPGRLLDHIKHTESLRLHDVQCFVLDEADRMLDMGYEKDISGVTTCPTPVTTCLEYVANCNRIVAALIEQKGLPRFGVKRTVKIESDNSGYNPLQILRQNAKKIFTDKEVDSIETETSKSAEKSVIKTASVSEEPPTEKVEKKNVENVDVKKTKPLNVVHSEVDSEEEEDEDEDESTIKKEYHSGTESDSDETGKDFPIRMEKNKRIKPFASARDKTKMIVSQHKIKTVDSEYNDSNNGDVEADEKDPQENLEPPQISSDNKNRRQTVLLSATLTQAVEKLAGLTMDNPVIVDAARENLEKSGGSVSEINEDLIVPQSVVQTYVVTPPKLRLVSLSAFIAGKCQAAGQHKTLVFMATQDMIDYHADILSTILCKPSIEDDEDSEPLVDVEFFKLHGNMTQRERTDVFKTFRAAKSGVLLCTDVAARGLDLPKVDSVVQYTSPLSARDYVHRVGRTARAGSSGSAVIFLTPPEVGFIRMLESRRVRIQQEDMDNILDKLLGPLSNRNSVEAAATALQNQFENLVLEDKEIHKKACKAYVSWIRFYASYPKDMREIFDRKELHLGHFAKSFGLRDPPQRIGGIGRALEDNGKKVHENRLSNERPKKIFTKRQNGGTGSKPGALKKVRMLNTSEYGSGLHTIKKQKKF